MKAMVSAALVAALLAGASVPVQAQSLLGGLIGNSSDPALITLGSGDAGKSGLVNLGLGGDQILDLNVGSGDLATATVGSGGSGGLGANVGLLNNNARIGIGLGGDDLLDVDIGIGNGGGGGNGGLNPGNGVLPLPGRSVASNGGSDVVCQGVSGRELENLILGTRIDDTWRRARAVDVRRVNICPEHRAWLAAALRQTGLNRTLQTAIASDALLAATLSRTSHSADRVFAVRNDGSRLTVFVY